MEHQQQAKSDAAPRRASDKSIAPEPPASAGEFPAPFLQMHETMGNQALGRFIQAKLKVSKPGDNFEQEADRVAAQVMRMPDGNSKAVSVSESTASSSLQRA